jgi:uncharacterized membrane protein YqgA involved in biofilm formation
LRSSQFTGIVLFSIGELMKKILATVLGLITLAMGINASKASKSVLDSHTFHAETVMDQPFGGNSV